MSDTFSHYIVNGSQQTMPGNIAERLQSGEVAVGAVFYEEAQSAIKYRFVSTTDGGELVLERI